MDQQIHVTGCCTDLHEHLQDALDHGLLGRLGGRQQLGAGLLRPALQHHVREGAADIDSDAQSARVRHRAAPVGPHHEAGPEGKDRCLLVSSLDDSQQNRGLKGVMGPMGKQSMSAA